MGGATVTLEQVPDQPGLLHPNLPEVTQNKNFSFFFVSFLNSFNRI